MEISRATMKKLLLLIAFAALAFTAFQWIDGMAVALSFLAELLSPFLGGAALAFILNVPMRFLERNLFSWAGKNRSGKERLPKSLVRILSLLLTFVLVALVLMVLVLVIMPQLTETISGLTVTIQNAVTQFLMWAEDQFSNNPQVAQWLENLTIDWRSIDWESILSGVADFLRNGAGDVLNSTISAAKSMVSVLTSSFIAFVFACYILLQKEKLGLQCRKVLYAILPTEAAHQVIRCAASATWCLQLYHRPVRGGGDSGHRVLCGHVHSQDALYFAGRLSYLRHRPDPHCGSLHRLRCGCVPDPDTLDRVLLIFLVMFLILQQVEGNLIYPHVVGSSVGLPSIWVLFAVTIGGSLMGVVGMLLFIPLTSVIYTLFREFVYHRLQERHIKVK